MKLHARSSLLRDQVLEVTFIPFDAPGPILCTPAGLQMTIEAALTIYDVVEASDAESRILARSGHPFGGVQ